MMFIVMLLALLVERFFDFSHVRRWHWFILYERMIAERTVGLSPYLAIILILTPLLVAVFMVSMSLDGLMYGFVKFLFQLVVLIFCLGPNNLWADAFASINAILQSDPELAKEKLKMTLGVEDLEDPKELQLQLFQRVFIEANQRVLAVIVWYAILGPLGAVFYRTTVLCAEDEGLRKANPALLPIASTIEAILDWLPIRLFTFLFALSGHFVSVFSCWGKQVLSGIANNETLLVQCGVAALGNEIHTQDGTAEKNALSLIDRAVVLFLVLIALYILALGF